MTHVKIAEFKGRLSHYLNRIRNGDELVVTDRRTPIARVIPYRERQARLAIAPAKASPKGLKKLNIPRARRGTDSLEALALDRRDDLEG